jgi:hypothetical protein
MFDEIELFLRYGAEPGEPLVFMIVSRPHRKGERLIMAAVPLQLARLRDDGDVRRLYGDPRFPPAQS